MFIPRADRLKNIALNIKYSKDKDERDEAVEDLYQLADEIRGLEGQGSLLDVVAARAYATELISKRAYVIRAPSLWFNKVLLGLDEDLPLMPIEGFTGKPFVAMSPDDYIRRLEETQRKFRYGDPSFPENKTPILNEISGLITDAQWDFVKHDDVSGDARLLKAQIKLNSLLDKEEPEK